MESNSRSQTIDSTDTDEQSSDGTYPKPQLGAVEMYQSAIARLSIQVASLLRIVRTNQICISPDQQPLLWQDQTKFRSWYLQCREWLARQTQKYEPNPLQVMDDFIFDQEFLGRFLLELCPHCFTRRVEIQLHCGHTFCKECLVTYTRTSLDSDEFKGQLKCLSCFEELTEEDLSSFLSVHYRKLLKLSAQDMQTCNVCGTFNQFDGWMIKGFCQHICLNCLIDSVRKDQLVCQADGQRYPDRLIEKVHALKQLCANCTQPKSAISEFEPFPCLKHPMCKECVRICCAKRRCLPCRRMLSSQELEAFRKKLVRCLKCRAVRKFDPQLKCQCLCETCVREEPCRDCNWGSR
jgi:hypothetical protein